MFPCSMHGNINCREATGHYYQNETKSPEKKIKPLYGSPRNFAPDIKQIN